MDSSNFHRLPLLKNSVNLELSSIKLSTGSPIKEIIKIESTTTVKYLHKSPIFGL